MKRIAAMAGVVGLMGALAVGATSASAAVVDEYCSESGDVCLSVQKKQGAVYLRIATFSFRGEYDLCVKQVGGQRICNPFRLKKDGPIYKDRVRWERHFVAGPGSYKATWRLGGSRIGPALKFRSETSKRSSCNSIKLGEPRVFYKHNMPCKKAKRLARRLYKTDGREEPKNFECTSGSRFREGAACIHVSKPKNFGWHPAD